MSRDLARALARGLHLAGVRTMFGVPGGGPNLDMIGAAQELGIGFLLAHGEFAACVMAATHGRLTGSPGVVLVTRGPGLTSAANGLAQATLDRFPLLLISDAVPAAHAARYAHQRLDQVAVAAPIAKWSGVLGTADPTGVVAAAARLATTAPAGAVHLAFDPTVPGDVVPAPPTPPETDRASLRAARRLLDRSRRPVVIVGLDAARHTAAVREMVETLNCPVFVTYQAKGAVPESWPHHAGLFTGAEIERPVLEEADVIVGIGLDPVEPTPTAWQYRAPVILLHSHAVETAYFGEPLLLVGPYDELHSELIDHWHSEWEPGGGGAARRRAVDLLEAAAPGLSPHDVVRATRHVLGDVLVTVDAGAHMLVVMPLWHTDEPDSVLISNGLATMGFALPAAIAAALARPGRRVVCFVGDGGLGMVLSELETLARLRLDVTVVVFNDATLTLIGLKQRNGQGDAAAVGYAAMDFAGVAAASGIPSRVAEDVRGLEDALSSVRQGPLLVDTRIDPSPYPHVIRVTRG